LDWQSKVFARSLPVAALRQVSLAAGHDGNLNPVSEARFQDLVGQVLARVTGDDKDFGRVNLLDCNRLIQLAR
jgi:hypothetical protein